MKDITNGVRRTRTITTTIAQKLTTNKQLTAHLSLRALHLLLEHSVAAIAHLVLPTNHLAALSYLLGLDGLLGLLDLAELSRLRVQLRVELRGRGGGVVVVRRVGAAGGVVREGRVVEAVVEHAAVFPKRGCVLY